MGQYWEVYNIDKMEVAKRDGGAKLGNLVCTMGQQMLGFLVRLKKLPMEEWRKSVIGIARVPPELLLLILDLLDPWNLVCLYLTCKQLYVNLHERVWALMEDEYGHWAGDRILIRGDYATTLPKELTGDPKVESILVSSDYEIQSPGAPEADPEADEHEKGPTCHDFPEFSLRKAVLWRLRGDPDLDDEHWQWWLGETRPFKLGQRSTALFPPDKIWVLRNLTEKICVRLDAVSAQSERGICHPPFMRGLGELLLWTAHWTDDPSGVLGESCHGEWAGHRFDVTYLDDTDMKEIERWTDVSEDYAWIAEEMEKIYQDDL
ncbi:MAG: hypothetical protein M1821_001934 [Bathelium mastoideum]|nr:MAG: hypothetical protein M1821_001934 [Bathelium mastoideum]